MSIFFLLLLFQHQEKMNCQGCCSRHGGVECVNGITRCADGTSLSATCTDKGCNACDTPPPPPDPPSEPETQSPPSFLNESNLYLDGEDNLVLVLPDPNSDGTIMGDDDKTGYQIKIRVGCRNQDELSMTVEGPWPATITLPTESLPEDPYSVDVVRTHPDKDDSAAVALTAPYNRVAHDPHYWDHQRWLLHIPKKSGGFDGLIKIHNPLDEPYTVKLLAFSEDGRYRSFHRQDAPGGETLYLNLYGGEGIFSTYTDRISHIAVQCQTKMVRVSLGITGRNSGFRSWSDAVDLGNGLAVGRRFIMEARHNAQYADGIAVLNLREDRSVELWVTYYDHGSDTRISEKRLGLIPAGGKRLFLLSELFPFHPQASYTIETRTPGATIQVTGMVFFGADFFSALPVRSVP